MANDIRTIITVSESVMEQLKRKYFINGELSFNAIQPMPKDLNLTDGFKTNEAIIYAYLRKNEQGREKIKSTLLNVQGMFHGSVWNELEKRIEHANEQEYLEKYQDYTPGEDEKELGITDFESLGDKYIDNADKYKVLTWYNWSIVNWGTKWDLSRFECNNTQLSFETAWSCPIPILDKLSKKISNETFEVCFADENIGSNCGKFEIENGSIKPLEVETSAEEFAKFVWDYVIEQDKEAELEL